MSSKSKRHYYYRNNPYIKKKNSKARKNPEEELIETIVDDKKEVEVEIKEELDKKKDVKHLEKVDFKKVQEITPTEEFEYEKNKYNGKYKHHFSYTERLLALIAISIVLVFFIILFVINIVDINKENFFYYKEKSTIDYKVKLKENNFYDVEYLEKDMLYVASLIDSIDIDFKYDFLSEQNIDINFNYDIYAKLIITDFNDTNTYYEKDYKLITDKNSLLRDAKDHMILETININYDEYNKIANNFKNSYGLSTKSKLVLYFDIEKSANDVQNTLVSTPSNIFLEIPLSEKSIDIGLNYKDINNNNKIIIDKDNSIKINKIFLILSLVLLIILIALIFKSIKLIKYLFTPKSKYDLYIKKLLDEYDRLIVKTITPPIKNENDKDKIITIENFEELLDVRDNIKQPIMYFEITKHIKCQFYIKDDDKIYITTIKKVDIEEENEKV